MKKKRNKIFVFCVCIIAIIACWNRAFSKYAEVFWDQTSVSIARPIIRMEAMNAERISNGRYTNEFKVENYEVSGHIAETNLSYTLAVTCTIENLPFRYQLYQIESDGSEKEVSLLEDHFEFSANKKEEHKFRLEVLYHSDEISVENVDLWIHLDAIQI